MIPTEFLRFASRESLRDFEAAHLNLAANLTKKMKTLQEQIVQEMALADLARIVLENRELCGNAHPLQKCFDFQEEHAAKGPAIPGHVKGTRLNRPAVA